MPLYSPDFVSIDGYPEIEPSLRLDFANARALDPRITFTRASTATYVGRDGLIKYAGEDEARFDHDPTTGESLGLLIEEERINYTFNSTTASGWNNVRTTITEQNTIIAPDGTTDDVFLVQEDTATGPHHAKAPANTSGLSSIADGTTVTSSIWIKSTGTHDKVRFGINTKSDGYPYMIFSLTTGEITDYTGTISHSVTKYPNGWWRAVVTADGGTGTSRTMPVNSLFLIQAGTTNTSSYTGDGSNGVYVWGPQLEVGSFPTSYIPTSGSTVTREKEFPVIKTSSIDFSDFSQGGEGTLVCEFSNAGAIGSDVAVCFSGDTHNGATFVGLGTNSNRNAFNRVRVNATNTVLSADTNFTTTGFYKVAFGIGQSKCTLAVRGSSSGVLEDTSVSYDTTPYTKLILGCDQTSSSSNNMINGTIKSVFYYPILLTDTQLQTLTQ